MPIFEQYQREFVNALPGSPVSTADADSPVNPAVLLASLPVYGSPYFLTPHRWALDQLMQLNMGNEKIVPQPDESGMYETITYRYTGPFTGYQNAFCYASPTAVSTAVATATCTANPTINPGWWQSCAIAVLTDAARQAAALSLNESKLSADLAELNKQFTSVLTASVLAILQTAYQPTVEVLSSLTQSGQLAQMLAALVAMLSADQFITNSNAAMSKGGDSAQAAVWFLYCIWVILMAVGCNDVDTEIAKLQVAGLNVPPQIGPIQWWRGGYTTWFPPLNGTDLSAYANGTLTAAMPEEQSIWPPNSPVPSKSKVTAANGYSRSLCYWGPYARYKN